MVVDPKGGALSSFPHRGRRLKSVEDSRITGVQIVAPARGCGLKCHIAGIPAGDIGHPPHGGCGLKCFEATNQSAATGVTSRTEVWVEIYPGQTSTGETGVAPPHGGVD